MKKRNRRRSTSTSLRARRTQFEALEQRCVLSATPTLAAIGDITLYEGAPINLPLDAVYDLDGPLTYTVECSDPNVNVYVPEGNRSMKISISAEDGTVTGDMIFELFEQRAPRATNQIISLVEDGFYDGLTFHRVIDEFMIQGGDPTGTGSGDSYLGDFDDQFHLELMHTGSGVLSMAKTTDDTNDCQFFITEGPTRHLDFQHSVFGQLVEGEDLREALSGVDTDSNDKPLSDMVMESVEIFEDNENAILVINAPDDYAGSSEVTITVTIHDQDGNAYVQTPINVTIQDDIHYYEGNGTQAGYWYEEESGSFFSEFPTMRTMVNTPYSIDLSQYVQDAEGIDTFEDPDPGEEVSSDGRTVFRDAYGMYSIVKCNEDGEPIDYYGNVLTNPYEYIRMEYIPYLEDADLQYNVNLYTGVATFEPTNDLVGTYPFPIATGLSNGYDNSHLDKQVAALNIVPETAPDSSIAMTLVTESTEVDGQGEVESLPDEAEWVNSWEDCSVEVWAKIDDDGQFGIYSVETDLAFDPDQYQVTNIEWGVGFSQEQTGTIDNVNGTITDLGGTTKWYSVIPYHETEGYANGDGYAYPSSGAEDLIMWGDDQYVLVARVDFEPVATSEAMTVDRSAGYSSAITPGFSLTAGDVKWNSEDGTSVALDTAVDTEIWAVPYDLNADGNIDLEDIGMMLQFYRWDVTEVTRGQACDFNRDGVVDLQDLSELLPRFRYHVGMEISLPSHFPPVTPVASSAALMGTQLATTTKMVALSASDLASYYGKDDSKDDKDEASAVDLLMALYADAE